MGDSRRENALFSLNWRTCEEKTDVFRVKWGILEEKICDFFFNGGFAKRKRDFRINMGFV